MNIHFDFVKQGEKMPSGWYITYQGKLASSKKIAEVLNVDEEEIIDILLEYNSNTFMQNVKASTAPFFRDIIIGKREYYYYYTTKKDVELAYNELLLLVLSKN